MALGNASKNSFMVCVAAGRSASEAGKAVAEDGRRANEPVSAAPKCGENGRGEIEREAKSSAVSSISSPAKENENVIFAVYVIAVLLLS